MNNPSRPKEYHLKILMVGEASTGKTSFIRRYVHRFFSNAYRATIGIDYAMKLLNYDENTTIRLSIWDIAGQERFGSMTRAYYKDAVGAFIAFDVNKPKTFESVLKWKHDLDEKVSLSDGSPIPCLVLANKCDLMDCSEQDMEQLSAYAQENGFIGCIYTSPKLDINIDNAANILVTEILKRNSALLNGALNGNGSGQRDGIIMNQQHLNRAARQAKERGRTGCCSSG